jgi:hypothetical protein
MFLRKLDIINSFLELFMGFPAFIFCTKGKARQMRTAYMNSVCNLYLIGYQHFRFYIIKPQIFKPKFSHEYST